MKTSLELLRQTEVNVADESKGLAKGLDMRGTGLTGTVENEDKCHR